MISVAQTQTTDTTVDLQENAESAYGHILEAQAQAQALAGIVQTRLALRESGPGGDDGELEEIATELRPILSLLDVAELVLRKGIGDEAVTAVHEGMDKARGAS